jgi:hypothetical protein
MLLTVGTCNFLDKSPVRRKGRREEGKKGKRGRREEEKKGRREEEKKGREGHDCAVTTEIISAQNMAHFYCACTGSFWSAERHLKDQCIFSSNYSSQQSLTVAAKWLVYHFH